MTVAVCTEQSQTMPIFEAVKVFKTAQEEEQKRVRRIAKIAEERKRSQYDKNGVYVYRTKKTKFFNIVNSLNKYIYEPYNQQTLSAITHDINSIIYSNYSTGITLETPSVCVHVARDEQADYFTIGNNLSVTVDHNFNSIKLVRNYYAGTMWSNGSAESIISTASTDYNTANYVYSDGYSLSQTQTVKDVIKQQIRQNLTILVKSRAKADALSNASQNELVALETLREMISEEAFRKYLKYGFILVKGQEGKVYQIYKSKSHTRVWKGGRVIEEICVRIKSDVAAPLTDNVIAFKTMIEANEEEFRKMGNVYNMQFVNNTVRVAA
jgi:hypothetical protein